MVAEVPPELEDGSRQPVFSCAQGVTTLRVVVWGEPKPKARPRITRNAKTGFVHAYTPDSTLSWEQSVSWQVKQALTQVEVDFPGVLTTLPWTGRTLVSMRFNVRRPTSTPKKVKYPMKGADIDNMAKAILDACQNVALLKDDKIVTDLFAVKRFEEPGHPMGVEIEFTHFDE
jgi:Holliday junction resolvase RusA-like endonuclease